MISLAKISYTEAILDLDFFNRPLVDILLSLSSFYSSSFIALAASLSTISLAINLIRLLYPSRLVLI